MKKEQDYRRDIAEIRNLMERSAKFLALSGWAGVMAGIYALIGSYVAYRFLNFNQVGYESSQETVSPDMTRSIFMIGLSVLLLTLGTGFLLSFRRARKMREPFWNGGTRRVIQLMGMPLVAGGFLLLLFLWQGSLHLLVPVSLIFYGLAIYNAGHFSYRELQYLGITEVLLGMMAALLPTYGLAIWATGFGLLHIVYGIYIYMRHQQ
ncbi:MAG: hypothetical protein FJX94_01730 [Bacteroidetes bacterium]|nr:hypothetical protein [Bacteroidota bacterium]